MCAGLPCGVTGCAERREVLGWLLCLRRQPGPALPSGRHRREQRLQRPRLRFHNDRGDDRCCCMECGGWAQPCRTMRVHRAHRRLSEGRRCQTPITESGGRYLQPCTGTAAPREEAGRAECSFTDVGGATIAVLCELQPNDIRWSAASAAHPSSSRPCRLRPPLQLKHTLLGVCAPHACGRHWWQRSSLIGRHVTGGTRASAPTAPGLHRSWLMPVGERT